MMDPAIISAWAAAGTFGIAAVGLIIAVRQIRASREIAAQNAYESYHHLALQYPDFSGGFFDFDGATAQLRRTYKTYVMSMLLTAEKIVTLFPKDLAWKAAIEDDIQSHLDFIGSAEFETSRLSLDPKLIVLIDEVLSKSSARSSKLVRPRQKSSAGRGVAHAHS